MDLDGGFLTCIQEKAERVSALFVPAAFKMNGSSALLFVRGAKDELGPATM